jgi:Mce-associated membrane protein
MPPPRRRRPVQPATRVRIPRTARSRGAGESAGGRLPVAEAPETDLVRGDLAHDEPVRDDLAHDDLTEAEQAGKTVTGDEQAGKTVAGDEQAGETVAGDEPTGETLTRDEPTSSEPTTEDKQATGEPTTEDEQAAEGASQDEPTADEQAADEPSAEGTAQDEPTADEQAADEQAPAAAPGPSRHPLLLPAGLGGLAVVLGGLAVWFGLEASSATSGVDTSNTALTDPVATRQVTQQVTSAVNKIFSYNYADTAKTSQAAATLLTGKARQQYDALFKLVRQDAPKEKLVLTTTVTNSGVEFLDGSRARLLIFANQRDTAGTAHKTTDAGAMFAVNAVNQGGQWKISSIDTFGAAS